VILGESLHGGLVAVPGGVALPLPPVRPINPMIIALCTFQTNHVLAVKTEVLFFFNRDSTTPTWLLAIAHAPSPFVLVIGHKQAPELYCIYLCDSNRLALGNAEPVEILRIESLVGT
jgi:hypothetical protein